MAIFNSFLYVYQAGSPQFLMKSPWKRWHRHRPQPRRSPALRRLRRSDATSVAAWRRSWNRPWILTEKNHGALGFSSSNSGDSMIWKRITRCPVRKPKTGEPKELCWGFGSEDVEVDQCDLKQHLSKPNFRSQRVRDQTSEDFIGFQQWSTQETWGTGSQWKDGIQLVDSSN